MKSRNVIRVALGLATAMAVAAACGVANPFSPAAAVSNNQDRMLKWAQCMRQHGVNVPDPVNGQITVRASIPPNGDRSNLPGPGNPQFQAAQNACQQYAPNGGTGGRGPSQAQIDQATRFAQCMRDHGIPMQDPKVQGGGIVMQGGGPNGPAIDSGSDQFKQAQQACAKYQPGGPDGGSRTTGGGGGSGTAIGGNG